MSGRNGWPCPSCNCGVEPTPIPKPNKLGVGLREGKPWFSSRSTLRTRVHRCFQMSSERRGPGSSDSPSLGGVGAVPDEVELRE